MKGRNRRRKKIKKKYFYRRLIFLFILLIFLLAIVYFFLSFSRIEKVEIKGMARMNEQKVEKIVNETKGKNYFFLNKHNLEKKLKDIPYVKSVDLSYAFPKVLLVKIKEETPYAQIFIKEGYVLVNEKLKILEKTKTFDTSLPKITGIQARKSKPGSVVFPDTSNSKKKDFFLHLFSSKMMDEIASIDIMEQGVQIFTKSGVKIIIRSYHDSAYKLKQLEKIYPEIQKSEEEFGTILLDQSDHPIAIKKSDLDKERFKSATKKLKNDGTEKNDKSKDNEENNTKDNYKRKEDVQNLENESE